MSTNLSNPKTYASEPKSLQAPAQGGGSGQNPTNPPVYPGQPGNTGGTSPGTPGLPGVPVVNRNQFIKNYAAVAARCWVDQAFYQLLTTDPVSTLASAGIPTVPGAQIVIVENKITGIGRVEDQVDEWIKGNQTGQYLLWLPVKPDDINITGAGGGPEGGASCCCCPCCSCT